MKAEPIPKELLSDNPSSFESNYVHDVYDTIASHFSATRYKKWPVIENFIASLPVGSIVLDVGCGNGKYAPPLSTTSSGGPPHFHVGIDHSEPLVRLAIEHHFMEGIVSDSLLCPIKSSFADAVISVAVIHHFSTIDRRRDAVKELFRMCRPNGRVLIYVWALEQGKHGTKYAQRREFDGNSQDVFVPWKLRNTAVESKDNDQVTKFRYYHLFAEGELETIVSEAAEQAKVEVVSVQSGYDSDNWYVIVEVGNKFS